MYMRHKLLEKNEETMTGVCAVCGPVAVLWRNNRNLRYVVCKTARNLDRHKYGKLPLPPNTLALLASQNNSCAICKDPLLINDVNMDHCHESNRWRGSLCRNCNLGLGYFKDNVESMQNAIDYVNTHH